VRDHWKTDDGDEVDGVKMEETTSASAEGSKEDKVKILRDFSFISSFSRQRSTTATSQTPKLKGGGIYCGGCSNQHSLVLQRRWKKRERGQLADYSSNQLLAG